MNNSLSQSATNNVQYKPISVIYSNKVDSLLQIKMFFFAIILIPFLFWIIQLEAICWD